jgi:hypothetical protein
MPSEAHVGAAALGCPGRNPATLLSVRMNESLASCARVDSRRRRSLRSSCSRLARNVIVKQR